MHVRAYKTLLVEADAGIATLTLHRPARRNALSPQLINELLYALEDAVSDEQVRCIVLTGTGSVFCAGADLAAAEPADSELPPKGGYDALLLRLSRMPKPVIARVNGHALGGGLGLVAASTFAIATTEAELGAPELKLGLFPFMIYAVLERLLPRRRLVELLLCSQKLQAREAAELGLLNRAVASSELDAAVKELTDSLRLASPTALRLGLQAMHDVEGMELEAKLPVLSQRLLECFATDDAREGITAFREKRPARWMGP